MTWGILSGVGRYQYPSGTLLEYGDCLQTDASINPGNSGGPLYDASGKLLGIVGRASFEKRGRVNVGVGYAISIQQAKNFLGALRSGRIVDHATLGATVATDPDGGVRISNVLESSDAYRRGLRYGAEILEIDGRTVRTANEVQKVLATLPSGWRVKVRYRSSGETQETLVRLMGVHREDELLEKMAAALPPPPPRPEPRPAGRPDSPDDPDSGETPDVPDGLKKMKEAEEGGQAPVLPQLKVREKKVPESVAAQLIERRGYANYFFNEQQQGLVFASLSEQMASPQAAKRPSKRAAWVMSGVTEGEPEVPFRCEIGNGKLLWALGNERTEFSGRSELYDAINRQSTSSMIAAMDGLRRLLDQGTKEFGEIYYWGTMPLGGQRPLRDCLVGNDGELELRWLTHPDTRRLEAMEVFADRDLDPLEVWFQYDDSDSSRLTPIGLEVRFGTQSRLRLRVQEWGFADPAEENPGVSGVKTRANGDLAGVFDATN